MAEGHWWVPFQWNPKDSWNLLTNGFCVYICDLLLFNRQSMELIVAAVKTMAFEWLLSPFPSIYIPHHRSSKVLLQQLDKKKFAKSPSGPLKSCHAAIIAWIGWTPSHGGRIDGPDNIASGSRGRISSPIIQRQSHLESASSCIYFLPFEINWGIETCRLQHVGRRKSTTMRQRTFPRTWTLLKKTKK